jgi:hypothetical protein
MRSDVRGRGWEEGLRQKEGKGDNRERIRMKK